MSSRIFTVISFLAIAAASIWCTDAAEAQQVITDGLVSFWTFDRADVDGNTVMDIVGDNDGIMEGGKIVDDGKINAAIELDGSSFVDCGGDESLNLTDALTLEGEARELIHAIQVLRKDAGLEFTDTISLQLEGADAIMKAHEKLVLDETRAVLKANKGKDEVVVIGERKINVSFERVK